jgi:hypothetical protein
MEWLGIETYDRLVDITHANGRLMPHDHAIRTKAEIMVDHFHEQVIGLGKVGGEARAMVVTSRIERAIQYFYAIRDYRRERKSPYRASWRSRVSTNMRVSR